MKVSILNNSIHIKDVQGLKKYQLSQLDYYGYEINGIELRREALDIQTEILKLITFLTEEAIDFHLNKNAGKLIEQLNNSREQFEKLFNKGRKVKSGSLRGLDSSGFKQYLSTLPRPLKDHQVKAAFHLYQIQNGANFSVPGSGKTSVVLAVYEKLKQEGRCNVLYVIGPPSCFQPWKNEFVETLGREPETTILSGGDKTSRKSEYYNSARDASELYLSTFQTASNDEKDVINFFAQKSISVFLVIDEAHYIKQLGGTWASSALKIGYRAAFRTILTGTPMPKSYSDMNNLFEFLWLNNSPIDNDTKYKLESLEKKKNSDTVKVLLNEKIGPLFYRVRKKELKLKDPVFHPPIICEMSRHEAEIYKYVSSRVTELSEQDYFQNEDALKTLWAGRMIRLRQAVSYPKLLKSAIDGYGEGLINKDDLANIISTYDKLEVPGKLLALTKLVNQFSDNGEKVLIWSNFIGTLELLKSHFLKLSKKCELIYGKTPIRKDENNVLNEEKTREDIRDEFLDPESGLDILIANPAACAESISLHKTCFNAVYYDLSYNCAQYIQSLDRIHRVGGSEENIANYYFLQYKNSLDQDIIKNLERKAAKMYEIIEQDYTIYDLDLYDPELDDDILAYKRLFKKSRSKTK